MQLETLSITFLWYFAMVSMFERGTFEGNTISNEFLKKWRRAIFRRRLWNSFVLTKPFEKEALLLNAAFLKNWVKYIKIFKDICMYHFMSYFLVFQSRLVWNILTLCMKYNFRSFVNLEYMFAVIFGWNLILRLCSKVISLVRKLNCFI